jgi:hypothetical protein
MITEAFSASESTVLLIITGPLSVRADDNINHRFTPANSRSFKELCWSHTILQSMTTHPEELSCGEHPGQPSRDKHTQWSKVKEPTEMSPKEVRTDIVCD